MKTRRNRILASAMAALLIAGVMMMAPPALAADQAPVVLGTTSHFAILAGQTITNTGATKISGDAGADVGLHPGSAITGQASITLVGGQFYASDPGGVALGAKNALITAYDDAAGRGPATNIPAELAGQVLIPGVYSSTEGFFHLNVGGKLTLDAKGDPNGVFIFKTTSSLIAESGSVVSLIGNARYCRVFWKVGSDVTLGTGATFIGHILALNSIWARTGAVIQGQLLARNGEVTLDTNTIINGFCGLSPAPTPGGGVTPVPGYTLAPGATLMPGVTFIPGTTLVPWGAVWGGPSSTTLPATGDKAAGISTLGILAAGAGIMLVLAGISLYLIKRKKAKS